MPVCVMQRPSMILLLRSDQLPSNVLQEQSTVHSSTQITCFSIQATTKRPPGAIYGSLINPDHLLYPPSYHQTSFRSNPRFTHQPRSLASASKLPPNVLQEQSTVHSSTQITCFTLQATTKRPPGAIHGSLINPDHLLQHPSYHQTSSRSNLRFTHQPRSLALPSKLPPNVLQEQSTVHLSTQITCFSIQATTKRPPGAIHGSLTKPPVTLMTGSHLMVLKGTSRSNCSLNRSSRSILAVRIPQQRTIGYWRRWRG